jgi:hypothetical protein
MRRGGAFVAGLMVLAAWQSAGLVSLSWDGRSADGRRAGPGLYFVRGVVGGSSVTRSVVRMN